MVWLPEGAGWMKPEVRPKLSSLRAGLGAQPAMRRPSDGVLPAANSSMSSCPPSPQREEIFKAGIAPLLQQLLERGDVEERHAAMGCVSVLALSEKHIAEVVNARVRRNDDGLVRGRVLA